MQICGRMHNFFPTVPLGTSGVSLRMVGCPFPHSGMFFKGITRGFPVRPAARFSHLFFQTFFEHPLGDNFGAFGIILVHLGYHFASMFYAPVHKNDTQNTSPPSTSPNPYFPYGYTFFIIFMIPKASHKAPKWRQHPKSKRLPHAHFVVDCIS